MRLTPIFLSLALAGCTTAPPVSGPTPTPAAVATSAELPPPSASPPQAKLNGEKRKEAPISLTASDGTGLKLVGYQGKAIVSGPLAFTELHLSFENPEDRVLEGRFQITLPPGAAISRLAMQIGDSWQEAEVVELQAARQAYEDALHRRQDPALMEKQAGNQFQARIFPIPAKGRKEIILSYSQELTKNQPYVMPLAGLPQVASCQATALVSADPRQQPVTLKLSLDGETPGGDWQIERTSPIQALSHQSMVVFEATPKLKQSADPVDSLLVLFDSSASRAPGFKQQKAMLEGILKGLGKARVRVACFDQEVGSPDYKSRRPLGATDVGRALDWAARQKGYSRLLLITDGVVTEGKSELAKRGDALKKAGFGRVDAVLVGGIRETQALNKLVFSGLTRSGVVLDGDQGATEIVRRLKLAASAPLKPAVTGALWVWPTKLEGLQDGDSRLVFAELEKPAQQLEVKLNGETVKMPLFSANGPLLTRASAEAHIARLEARLAEASAEEQPKLREQILKLSTTYRVVSSLTALLVLETDQDYARFGIDRKAMADILVVGDKGIETKSGRQMAAAPTPVPEVADKKQKPKTDTLFGEGDEEAPAAAATAAPAQDAIAAGADPFQSRRDGSAPPAADQTVVTGRQTKSESFEGAPAMEQKAAAPAPGVAREGQSGGQYFRGDQRNGQGGVGSLGGTQLNPRDNQDAGAPVARPQVAGRVAGSGGNAPAPPPPPPPPAGESRRDASESRRPPRYQGGVDDFNVNEPIAAPEAPVSDAPPPELKGAPALTGKMAAIMKAIKAGQTNSALQQAMAWRSHDPGDVLALVALGEALEAMGDKTEAARAYGSIVDLFPGRADLRRYAGNRLERLGKAGQELAVDSFRQAAEQRPDHPASHRMLAYALLRAGDYEGAVKALETGLRTPYPGGRFLNCQAILREDLGLVAAAWRAKDPYQTKGLEQRLRALGVTIADTPSTRFVLTWETDANDVDFHIQDSRGGHAFYGSMGLPSGGQLYGDVTTGYGPECFAIPGKASAYPYRLTAHYYSRGPMGYGMGNVETVQHDGLGHLKFEEHPFVVMNDQAFVNLGLLEGPLR